MVNERRTGCQRVRGKPRDGAHTYSTMSVPAGANLTVVRPGLSLKQKGRHVLNGPPRVLHDLVGCAAPGGFGGKSLGRTTDARTILLWPISIGQAKSIQLRFLRINSGYGPSPHTNREPCAEHVSAPGGSGHLDASRRRQGLPGRA